MNRLFIVIVPFLAPCYLALGQNTYTVCRGDTVRLVGTGGNLYEWQPHAGLDNPYSPNPIASPNTTTVYRIIKLQTSMNLIQNGDFSEGNQDFTSDYRDSSNVVREGYYAITTTPRAAHFAFRTCTDHSSGTGNMMVVNGSHFPNQKVWQQQITVRPHTEYAFSAYVNAGISSGDNAILQFSINGQLLSGATTFNNIRCTWQQFYAIWNSDTATTATIAVVNQNTQFVGNDFALDDILFQSFTTATDSAVVQVKPKPAKPAVAVTGGGNRFCQGNSRVITCQNVAGTTPLWNNGSRQRNQTVTTDSTLWVQVEATNGCLSTRSDTTDFIAFARPEKPAIVAIGDTGTHCEGDSLLLQASAANRPSGSHFEWNVSQTNADSLWVLGSGTFSSILVSAEGCESQNSNPIHLTFFDRPDRPSILVRSADTLMSSVVANTYIWKKNQILLPNSARKLPVMGPGVYTVQVVSPKGCASVVSPEYTVVPVGVSAPHENENLTIAPNPVRSVFRIRGLHHGKGILSVTDAAGRLISTWNIEENEAIEAQAWAPGIYVVRVQEDETVSTLKLMKN